MQVRFASRKLLRCFLDEAEAAKVWGPVVGRRYIQRVQLLQVVEGWDDLSTFQALRLHPLKGERRREWALTLRGRWRLIFERPDVQTILVKEVSRHYGD